ncbi:MAG: inorganic diphosphatase [Patescibacteria group bacterium]
MTDFNKLLTPKTPDGNINVVVEIPKGSNLKIEYRRETCTFELDRVEPDIFAKPTSYGFIPGTLDGDGDELDVLIICGTPLTTGIHLQAKIAGVLNFEDDGEIDHKIIAFPADNRDNPSVGLNDRFKEKIEFHFSHYKDLKKPGTTKVLGWGDVSEAEKIIEECIVRWQTQ